MTDEEVLALAGNALRLWGGHVVRLIGNRENAVFEVRLADGQRGALRLHRAGYQTDAGIRSELVWTEALAGAGFPCPAPVRTREDELLGCPAFGPRASVVGWIEAAPILGALDRETVYHLLGATIRRMHSLTDTLDLPGDFERPSWGLDALTSDAPHWGPFWENPALEPGERDLLIEARDAARGVLEGGKWDMGLIHADLLQENVLVRDGALSIIDFDDSGVGYRLYDLATALIQHHGAPDYDRLAAALCEGYGGVTPEGLEMFAMLRAMASAGWIMPRAKPGDPRMRGYAVRAVDCARAWLG